MKFNIDFFIRTGAPAMLANGTKAYILANVLNVEPTANIGECAVNPLNAYPLIGFSIDENGDIEYLQWTQNGRYIDDDIENENDIAGMWQPHRAEGV